MKPIVNSCNHAKRAGTRDFYIHKISLMMWKNPHRVYDEYSESWDIEYELEDHGANLKCRKIDQFRKQVSCRDKKIRGFDSFQF